MFRFPQLLQVIGHDIHRIRHHPSPAGQDSVEGSYPKSIEALVIGGTKNRKAQR